MLLENNQTLFQYVKRKYLFKLRSYSGYFCGLILAQLIAGLMLSTGSMSIGTSVANLSLTLQVYSAQIVLIFSVVWIFIISLLITTRGSKDASFSFPGNRLSDSISDVGYILTGCLFGGITTALFGAALRIEIFLLYSGNVMAQGFYPAFTDLCTIGAATFLYMLLTSAAGYFAGTLIRLSKMFIVVIISVVIFMFFSLSNLAESRSLGGAILELLFEEQSLGLFALMTFLISAVLYSLCTVISHRMEVRK